MNDLNVCPLKISHSKTTNYLIFSSRMNGLIMSPLQCEKKVVSITKWRKTMFQRWIIWTMRIKFLVNFVSLSGREIATIWKCFDKNRTKAINFLWNVFFLRGNIYCSDLRNIYRQYKDLTILRYNNCDYEKNCELLCLWNTQRWATLHKHTNTHTYTRYSY